MQSSVLPAKVRAVFRNRTKVECRSPKRAQVRGRSGSRLRKLGLSAFARSLTVTRFIKSPSVSPPWQDRSDCGQMADRVAAPRTFDLVAVVVVVVRPFLRPQTPCARARPTTARPPALLLLAPLSIPQQKLVFDLSLLGAGVQHTAVRSCSSSGPAQRGRSRPRACARSRMRPQGTCASSRPTSFSSADVFAAARHAGSLLASALPSHGWTGCIWMGWDALAVAARAAAAPPYRPCGHLAASAFLKHHPDPSASLPSLPQHVQAHEKGRNHWKVRSPLRSFAP